MKKKVIMMVMAMVLLGLTAQAEKVYSIDKFDGTYHQGHRSIANSSGDLMVAHGIGVKSYAWITFDVRDINWEKVTQAKINLYETANHNKNPEISLHVAFVKISESEYLNWTTPYKYIPNFNWLEQPNGVLHRHWLNKYHLTSENLLPQLKKIAKNKDYITLVIMVNPGPGWAGTIAFADGNPRNTIFRPYLEIKY
jgi:hypothetical protein